MIYAYSTFSKYKPYEKGKLFEKGGRKATVLRRKLGRTGCQTGLLSFRILFRLFGRSFIVLTI